MGDAPPGDLPLHAHEAARPSRRRRRRPNRLQIVQFMQWAARQPNTWFVTYQQLLAYHSAPPGTPVSALPRLPAPWAACLGGRGGARLPLCCLLLCCRHARELLRVTRPSPPSPHLSADCRCAEALPV